MKRLYLIRHAKSSWKDSSLDDFDRGLNKRGKNDIVKMSKYLLKHSIKPDLILSSPAKRAKKTICGIVKATGIKQEVVYNKNLYLPNIDDLMGIVRNIDDKYNEVFLVTHNYGITDLANVLGDLTIVNMPTCSIICIKFDVKSFQNIVKNSGKIVFFASPKKLDFT